MTTTTPNDTENTSPIPTNTNVTSSEVTSTTAERHYITMANSKKVLLSIIGGFEG